MSRKEHGFVPWWRLAPLPSLIVEALRHDRAFRWASAGALLCLALLVGRSPDAPAPGLAAGPRTTPGEASPGSTTIIPPPPAPPGPLPGPAGPPGGVAQPGAGPIAPSVPLGPAPAAPRDTFGTVPTLKAPAP